MTEAEDLRQEILDFIKNKREELEAQLDEFTMPFLKTIAEPESEYEVEYAQKELDDALMDKGDCDEFLTELEEWLNDNAKLSSKNQKGKV